MARIGFVNIILVLILASGTNGYKNGESFFDWQKRVLENLGDDAAKYTRNTRTTGMPFFDVEFENTPVPMTVHTLRPQDVDIFGAMGDSLSAGLGADGGSLASEARGNVFSVGGNGEVEDMITLPNIVKKFNRRVDGYSVGSSLNNYYHGFNVAVSGARSYNMPNQARVLIDRLKTDNRSRIDMDWKVVTMFIGGNDLCAIGRDPQGASPEAYVAGIQEALDILHAELPRTFVNVVDIMEIYVLRDVGYGYGSTRLCRILQRTFCGYVVTGGEGETEKLKSINKEYQVQLKELIDSRRYDTRDDFTVVLQPFLRDTVLPYTENGQVDSTWFAIDCFHFTEIAHAMCAANLWNNMLEPEGEKTTVWSIEAPLKVPTQDHPYFFTYKNSPVASSTETYDSCPGITESNETPTWAIVLLFTLIPLNLLGLIAILYFVSKKKTRKARVTEVHENEVFGEN